MKQSKKIYNHADTDNDDAKRWWRRWCGEWDTDEDGDAQDQDDKDEAEDDGDIEDAPKPW